MDCSGEREAVNIVPMGIECFLEWAEHLGSHSDKSGMYLGRSNTFRCMEHKYILDIYSLLVYSALLSRWSWPTFQRCTSETSENFNATTWCYNPEDSKLHTHRCENLKSRISSTVQLCEDRHCQATWWCPFWICQDAFSLWWYKGLRKCCPVSLFIDSDVVVIKDCRFWWCGDVMAAVVHLLQQHCRKFCADGVHWLVCQWGASLSTHGNCFWSCDFRFSRHQVWRWESSGI
jgi:hypothetical protein